MVMAPAHLQSPQLWLQLTLQPPQLWLQLTLQPHGYGSSSRFSLHGYGSSTHSIHHEQTHSTMPTPPWWTKTISQRTLSSLGCYYWSCCSQQYRSYECNIHMKVISDFFALVLLGVGPTADNPAQWIKVQLISSIASLWLLLSWLIQFVFWVKRLNPLRFIL